MTASRSHSTSDFDYSLPQSLIAQTPSDARGDSRLLVVDRASDTDHGPFRDGMFAEFPALMAPGDVLVLNTTKVRHARLLGSRPSGAGAEVLLIHPAADDCWVAIGKPGSALRPGKRILLGEDVAVETMEILPEGERVIRFIGATAAQAMERFGTLPLPPYIRRPPEAQDETRYQTVYADRPGSVAAPTAGLHFTSQLLDRIRQAGIAVAHLELEVGPGTFKPVEEDDPGRHQMHPERYALPAETAALVTAARAAGGRVWAVGTTVVRTLESAAGEDGVLQDGPGITRLMILPGYSFKVVDALITNFHLPRSTLLMLVSALAGHERIMAAYRHAVEQRYRFYSYGDAMAII